MLCLCENPEGNDWLLSLSLLSNSGICPIVTIPTATILAEGTSVSHLGGQKCHGLSPLALSTLFGHGGTPLTAQVSQWRPPQGPLLPWDGALMPSPTSPRLTGSRHNELARSGLNRLDSADGRNTHLCAPDSPFSPFHPPLPLADSCL